MKRPLSDKRPLGPVLAFSDNDADDNVSSSDLQSDISEYKNDIESTLDVSLTDKEARAIKRLQSPMLQSYVSNVLSTASQHNENVTPTSVIKSDATRKYARKLGATRHLENAKELLD